MRLTLACVDIPFEYRWQGEERKYTPDYVLVQDRVFRRGTTCNRQPPIPSVFVPALYARVCGRAVWFFGMRV